MAESGAPVPEDLADSFFENEREALEQHGQPDSVRKGPATLVKLGERTAARVEHELHGMTVITHVVLVDKEEVLVRAYHRPNLPPPWEGVVEKVAASVAAKP